MVRHGTKICQRPGNVRGESKEESQEFMKKLHTYIGHYWYGYLFAICSMIIATGLEMVYPQITQRIVDEVIIGGKMELLTGLLVGIVAVGIGRCIFGYCKEFSFDVLSSKIGAQIRKDLFRHIQTLTMNYFDNTNTGELMARVKDDVDKIWNAICRHADDRGRHPCEHGALLYVPSELETGADTACYDDFLRCDRNHHGAETG